MALVQQIPCLPRMYASQLGRIHLGGKSLLVRGQFCLGMGENICGAEKFCCWSLISGV